ncbi:uncharacterized protein LOC123539264 isoform X1 [Mercenaria mercenaria]|uniref:uncharacterized protein LOC123539264 isoform X1 n=1 Tax=Mercenaria mercenaria TaxID=6596 RepID=UPI00234ECCA1|nr:uncharacterized protein LOC123539264 isoform X1 [Mercenaria mercenaria]
MGSRVNPLDASRLEEQTNGYESTQLPYYGEETQQQERPDIEHLPVGRTSMVAIRSEKHLAVITLKRTSALLDRFCSTMMGPIKNGENMSYLDLCSGIIGGLSLCLRPLWLFGRVKIKKQGKWERRLWWLRALYFLFIALLCLGRFIAGGIYQSAMCYHDRWVAYYLLTMATVDTCRLMFIGLTWKKKRLLKLATNSYVHIYLLADYVFTFTWIYVAERTAPAFTKRYSVCTDNPDGISSYYRFSAVSMGHDFLSMIVYSSISLKLLFIFICGSVCDCCQSLKQ